MSSDTYYTYMAILNIKTNLVYNECPVVKRLKNRPELC